MERPLEGKVVLVTGAGVRLGRGIAEDLGRAGASVAVHFHGSGEGAADAVRTLCADGNRAQAFQADLRETSQAEGLIEQVEAALGPVTALVNSAALFHRAPFLETTDQALDDLWRVNARGPFVLTRALARRMVARDGGDVIFVLDIGGVAIAWSQYAAYCMTKGAMASLTRCLALELAPRIRVNAVAPGTVLPPEDLDPAFLDRLRERIPQQRFGSPADIAQSVRFLLTGPRFLTGQILAVDGGRSLGTRLA